MEKEVEVTPGRHPGWTYLFAYSVDRDKSSTFLWGDGRGNQDSSY